MGRVFVNGPGDRGSIQVESYQRFKKWYLIPLCLTISIIRYLSRVKWNNPGKWVVPSPTPWCSSYRKGSFLVTLDNSRQQQQKLVQFNRLINLVGRVFTNGQGDLGSIPGRVIQGTLKCYLIPPCLTLSNIR